ncbi:MAG: hypothetical protein R2713_18575 [Ilumatobacteraceae bacterium]
MGHAGPRPEAPPLLVPCAAPPPRAQRFAVGSLTPVDRYLSATTARGRLCGSARMEGVIAREVEVMSDELIDAAVLRRLRPSFGSSHRYSIDGLVRFARAASRRRGAIGTRLAERRHAAGTDTDRRAAELLASTKDQVEHRAVIDMIHDTLLPWCSYLTGSPSRRSSRSRTSSISARPWRDG